MAVSSMSRSARAQVEVVAWSVGAILALLVLAHTVTPLLPPFWGYHGTLLFYWGGLCLPVIWRHGGGMQKLWGFDLSARARIIVPAILAMQCIAVGVGALLPVVLDVMLAPLILALAVAAINAPLEEMTWRGVYLRTFEHRPALGFVLSCALFGLVHVVLAAVAGVNYPGGWPALVGGSFGLGLFWAAIVWRTHRIGWVVIAHTITNILAFTGLNVINVWP